MTTPHPEPWRRLRPGAPDYLERAVPCALAAGRTLGSAHRASEHELIAAESPHAQYAAACDQRQHQNAHPRLHFGRKFFETRGDDDQAKKSGYKIDMTFNELTLIPASETGLAYAFGEIHHFAPAHPCGWRFSGGAD